MDKVFFKSFNIAGFTYYNGPFAFKKLSIGTPLKLKRERDNYYDENAVGVYFKKEKLGYIPRRENYEISKLLDTGYKLFTTVVQQVSPDEHPENQVRVAMYLTKIS